MKRKFILPVITFVVIASAFTVVDQNGKSGYTGSPRDGQNCSSCHLGSPNGVPTISITATPAFGAGNTYVTGTTYTINVLVAGNYPTFGFDLEMLNSTTSTAGFAGTCTAITACKIKSSNVTHTAPLAGGISNPATFTYKWVAPASGNVYVYIAGLGTNNNGNDGSGDQVATTSYTLTPASAAGIATHQSTETNLSIFPNPATDQVRISYTLRERGNVSVRLYNLNGELVADLLNQTQDIGIQNTDAHLPEGLAKGLYMVRMTINGQASTQKLMVY